MSNPESFNQEIFNRVVIHLRKQGERSRGSVSGKCVYHAPDGKKCAVGVLINEAYWSPQIEGVGVHIYRVKNAVAKSLGTYAAALPIPMLRYLQGVHDHTPVGEWESEFREAAILYSLTLPLGTGEEEGGPTG